MPGSLCVFSEGQASRDLHDPFAAVHAEVAYVQHTIEGGPGHISFVTVPAQVLPSCIHQNYNPKRQQKSNQLRGTMRNREREKKELN